MTIPSRFMAGLSAAALLLSARAEERSWREHEPPKIPARGFSITAFGALGDGKTMNTDAFNEKGAKAMAGLVMKELPASAPELKEELR